MAKFLNSAHIKRGLGIIKDKPILVYIIESIIKYNITEIILCTGYLHKKIKDFFDQKNFGVKIIFSIEENPLGTAGALDNVNKEIINENFLLIYGDVIFDIDLFRLIEFHLNIQDILP